MEQKIILTNGTEMPVISVYGSQRVMQGSNREVLEITVVSDYAAVKGGIAADDSFIIRQTDMQPVIDTEGNDTGEVQTTIFEFYKKDYAINGDIVDHQDGTTTYYIGKKTDYEKLEEENAKLLFESITGEV